ncbi:MAG: helix-turn-helix transcriptional regulator [Lentisphaeria bacterium]|nr:helix-turn-helix transcriptional regulator [Lentisphaeria bacterium]
MARKNYNALRARMTPEQRTQSEAMARETMAELLLSEVRREAGLTQEDLAAAMGVKQPALSKLESQDDMRISTLRRLVHALGGELEIVAHLPQGDIRISQFAETAKS